MKHAHVDGCGSLHCYGSRGPVLRFLALLLCAPLCSALCVTPSHASSSNRVEYLLITSSNLSSAFQGLADYRTTRGLTAEVVTVESIATNYTGIDLPEKIRNCVRATTSTGGRGTSPSAATMLWSPRVTDQATNPWTCTMPIQTAERGT